MTSQGTWDSMLTSPLSINDIVIGETLWAGTKGLFSGIAILTVCYGFGIAEGWEPPRNTVLEPLVLGRTATCQVPELQPVCLALSQPTPQSAPC